MATKNKFEFDKVFDKLQQMKPKLPQAIAAIAQSSFVKNFNDESFAGTSGAPAGLDGLNRVVGDIAGRDGFAGGLGAVEHFGGGRGGVLNEFLDVFTADALDGAWDGTTVSAAV